MRSKIIILVVAVVLGLLSAFFVARYLDSARADIAAQAEPVRVLVATRDIPAGTTATEILSQDYSEEQLIPRQYVADGAISSSASIDGKVLAVPLTRGEQLTTARFKVAEEVGLSFALPEGYVAISVPDSESRGVSGFVSPGDYVMVIASFDSGGLDTAVTKTLISKARVLAAGTETSQTVAPAEQEQGAQGGLMNSGSAGSAGTGPATITLAVTPVDAERIVFAHEAGSVWYALLSSSTTTVPATTGEKYPQVLR
jgi:pilus assembly protein CpaB